MIDVDSLFGDFASEVDLFSVSSVQVSLKSLHFCWPKYVLCFALGLSTSSLATTPPMYANPKQAVEVVVPSRPAWVDQHLAEKQSVIKVSNIS